MSWDAYELFRTGEQDSNMARDSFTTFIPLSVDSDARTKIIFDFFDLLAAVAAHGKTNGLGGRKLSRMAGWWAFEHTDSGKGFDGGYKGWSAAADATSHLFFAYLRSMSPDSVKGVNGISTLPLSLQKLVQETEYPPQQPSLMLYTTPKVVMIVDSVSPTPFALLRRANNFQYRDEDQALQDFSKYEDPVKALTDECRRVLSSISSSNQTQISSSKNSTGLKDASWSRFEDIGFSGAFDEAEEDEEENGNFGLKKRDHTQGLRSTPHSGTVNMGRPTTPSWADFLSSGFVDEKTNNPSPLLLPPDKILPPFETSRGRSSQSHRPRLESDRTLEPGELASISRFELDESFWWVWISSLAGEEPAERKAAFGRCALVETVVPHGKWLVIEEQVKGAAPEPDVDAYVAEKKSRFGWTMRGKGVSRSKSGNTKPEMGIQRPSYNTLTSSMSNRSIGPDQHARIQAAAAKLQQKQRQQETEQYGQSRRGRDDADTTKTNSVMTLQPVIINELSPAMKWANKYDKDAIKEAYLANSSSGKGTQSNGHANGNGHLDPPASIDQDNMPSERELPPVPQLSSRSEAELDKTVETAMSPSAVPPAPLPPTPEAVEQSETGHVVDDKTVITSVTDLGLKESHPLERERATTPIRRKAETQETSHLITPPRKTQQQSLAQFLSEDVPSVVVPSRPSVESPPHNKLKKKTVGGGGFKKMFGRNKNRDSFQKAPEAAAAAPAPKDIERSQGQLQPGGATLGRRFSGFRKKSNPEVTPVDKAAPAFSQAPPSIAESVDRTPTRSPEVEGPQPYDRSYDPSVQESLSRVDTADAHEARQAFSSFDQGPLSDVPAFVPEVSPASSSRNSFDAAPPPVIRRVPVAPGTVQARAAMLAAAANRSHVQAPVVVPGGTAREEGMAPVQDRWAQIRKNAAERAAARQSEDQKSAGTDGDGETSGEETIESRVARIKARVAELTGNMDEPGRPSHSPARR